MTALALSDPSRVIAGVVLLTIVTIEVGGWFLVRIAHGDVPMTDFQKAFARAGLILGTELMCGTRRAD